MRRVADQIAARGGGHHLGQLGLADAGGAFHQHGLLELVRQEDHGRDLLVTDVLLVGQALLHLLDRIEHAIKLLWRGAGGPNPTPRLMLQPGAHS